MPSSSAQSSTGMATRKRRPAAAFPRLREQRGAGATTTLDGAVQASGCLRTVGVSLLKIANDVRFLGSGPRAGIGELALPEVQPGSSIMPGKVNPVIAESLIQVCAQVIGNDTAVTQSGEWSFFELNTMMPVAAHNLLQSIDLLAAGSSNFATQCVDGLEATSQGPDSVERGLMLATALAPVVGYDKAAAIAKDAAKSGRTIAEVARYFVSPTWSWVSGHRLTRE